MGTQEVVVCDDKSGEGNGAVIGFETAGWADVEFKSSVETFDELFEWPKFSGFLVEILKSDDLTVFNGGDFLRTVFI